MERNTRCENMVMEIIKKHDGCRIEAFNGQVYDRRTVNAAVNILMLNEKTHTKGLAYHLGAPPYNQQMYWNHGIPKPKLKLKKNVNGRTPTHKLRAKKFTGELTDNSSTGRRS